MVSNATPVTSPLRTADPWRVATSRAVHPSAGDGGDDPLVATIARGLASVSLPWELSTGTTPTERCYEQLIATDRYDVWLVHWPAGTSLEAHDHGGSAGAFAVVDGCLDEDTTIDGVTTTRRVERGSTVWFDEGHVHAVANRGVAGATSIHVYSPPLASMDFYRAADHGAVVARTDHATDWT